MIFLQKLYNDVLQLAARYIKNRIGYLDVGIVSEVDPTTHAAKVLIQPGNFETNWCPVRESVASVNGSGDSCLPQVGDHALVLYYRGSKQAPIIIGFLYNDQVPFPNAPNGELWRLHFTGSFLKFTNDGKVLLGASANTGTYPNAQLEVSSNLAITTVGKGLKIKEGTNAKAGVATLSSGTVVVSNTSVTASSRILLQRQSLGSSTAIGQLTPVTVIPGTSFTVDSLASNLTLVTQDNSTFYYNIIEPA